MKSLIVIGVVLLVATVAAGAFTVSRIRASFPAEEGRMELPGLNAPVEVRRDSQGVPHIYASTAADLFAAQGFVHAQDRFFEMDFRRHLTSGRLAEWFGPDVVDVDKLTRTLGWRRVADAEYELLRPETRRYLDAYANGVNAYLADRRGSDLSVEYTMGLLGPDDRIDPWTGEDSLAWLKAMAWDLGGNLDEEIARALASTGVSTERVDELYPAYPYDRHRPIVTDPPQQVRDAAPPGSRGRPVFSDGDAEALRSVSRVLESAPDLGLRGPAGGSGVGSNSWVVSGDLTESGKPLLANDPHLAPAVPSIWHQVGLHCRQLTEDCPFDVTGFGFAGLPGVVIGHNQAIAWGFTNFGADVMDLFVERLDGNTYLYDGTRLPLETRREVIRVKGQDPIELTVRSTSHGPLLSDVDQRARRAGEDAPVSRSASGGLTAAVALRWTALDPGRTADAIFAMNAATDWRSFRRAAKLFGVPAQNLVYADTEGVIAYQAPGRIPIRTRGTGQWPVPGWTGEYDWAGWVPYRELPRAKNPDEGFIVTANNAPVGPEYRHRLAETWAYGYRSQRITDRLEKLIESGGKVDAAAMAELQVDDANGFAGTLVPYLLDVEVNAFTRPARELLRGWDGGQPLESAPAAYFNAVWRHLLIETFADELPEEAQPNGGDRWYEVVGRLLERPDDPWWDDVGTEEIRETRDDVLRAAMQAARVELTARQSKDPNEWKWGPLHTLRLEHPVFGDSGVAPLEALFNLGETELPGGRDAVLATGWDAAAGGSHPYGVTMAPSMRMVVDLSDFDRSRWVNLTGVSGHPWHEHYGDQVERWARGETYPWPFTAGAVTKSTDTSFVLHP